MRAMADDEIGAGIDGRMGDVRHVFEDLLAEPQWQEQRERRRLGATPRCRREPSDIIRIGPVMISGATPGRLGGGPPPAS